VTPPTVTDGIAVQITRTFPNTSSHALFPSGTYSFGASGDQSAKGLLKRAISLATKFIYVEDQYLVDMDISAALKAALPNIQKLIILIVQTASIEGELLQGWQRRKSFVDNLTAAAASKVIVCQLKSPRYVHSKTWVFDDKFAIIGSANINRRGFTHDSEQTAGIFDSNARLRFFFAHELRMNLWAKHLKKRPIDFLDPIASSVNWSTPIGDVETYDPNADIDHNPTGGAPFFVTRAMVWDNGVDPDGS
jgi:phosphatidylserine/phosphatidylglycerophosphate/cardiolipin synthase-like enzyme